MSTSTDLTRDERMAHDAFVADMAAALIGLCTAHYEAMRRVETERVLPKDVLINRAKSAASDVQAKARAVAEILWTKAEQARWYRDLERAFEEPSPAPRERKE